MPLERQRTAETINEYHLMNKTKSTNRKIGLGQRLAAASAIAALLCVSVNAQSEKGPANTKANKRSVNPQTKKGSDGKTDKGRGRYRVTVIGFTCHNQTWDHTLEVDGKGDEVYIVNDVRVLNRAGAVIQAPGTSRSQTMGDTNGYEYRVKAGFASDRGGIRSGDSFPTNTPWIRRGGPTRDRPPMILWEGELPAGQTVTIIPTIWEWDGGDDMFTGWRRTIATNGGAIAGTAVGLVYGPAAGAGTASALQVLLPAASNFLGDVIGNASDRPIGLEKRGDRWGFTPQTVTFNSEIADNTIANDVGKGPGVVPVAYEDASELRGKYTLYLQIERIITGPAQP
jgi:hypothetical protein